MTQPQREGDGRQAPVYLPFSNWCLPLPKSEQNRNFSQRNFPQIGLKRVEGSFNPYGAMRGGVESRSVGLSAEGELRLGLSCDRTTT